jgi:hypothetical protein
VSSGVRLLLLTKLGAAEARRQRNLFSRRNAPEFCLICRPKRAWGMPRARRTRRWRVEKTRELVTTDTPVHPAFPHAMVLTVSFALLVIGLCCHRRLRGVSGPLGLTSPSRKLERQRRGVRTTRLRRPLQAPSSEAPPASTASHPASVTIAIRPCAWDGGEYGSDLGPARWEIFLKMRLDRYVTDLPVGQITGPPFDLAPRV